LHTRLISRTSISFFPLSGAHRDLHSFPTRRSSDLGGWFMLRRAAHTCFERRASRVPSGQRVGARTGSPPFSAKVVTPSLPRPSADRKSTRLNSSHVSISYAVFCLKKKNKYNIP